MFFFLLRSEVETGEGQKVPRSAHPSHLGGGDGVEGRQQAWVRRRLLLWSSLRVAAAAEARGATAQRG